MTTTTTTATIMIIHRGEGSVGCADDVPCSRLAIVRKQASVCVSPWWGEGRRKPRGRARKGGGRVPGELGHRRRRLANPHQVIDDVMVKHVNTCQAYWVVALQGSRHSPWHALLYCSEHITNTSYKDGLIYVNVSNNLYL